MKKATIDIFEKIYVQLNGTYDELSLLSKKAPDRAISEYKLKFVNDILSKANSLLKKYKPFDDFEAFQSDALPTNSDVVFIIKQYIKCLDKLKFDNSKLGYGGHWYWVAEDSDESLETSFPSSDLYK